MSEDSSPVQEEPPTSWSVLKQLVRLNRKPLTVVAILIGIAGLILVAAFNQYWWAILKDTWDRWGKHVWKVIVALVVTILVIILQRLFSFRTIGSGVFDDARKKILKDSGLATLFIWSTIILIYLLLVAPPLLHEKNEQRFKEAEKDRPRFTMVSAQLTGYTSNYVSTAFTFRNRSTHNAARDVEYKILFKRLDLSDDPIIITNRFDQDADEWRFNVPRIEMTKPFFTVHLLRYGNEFTTSTYTQNFIVVWEGSTNLPADLGFYTQDKEKALRDFIKTNQPWIWVRD